MNKILCAAAMAGCALAAATSASAAINVNFTPGGASPSPGYTIIDAFNNNTGLTGVQGTDYLLTTNHDGQGAPPANSIPYDSNYLSVLGGGTTSINFAALTGGAVKSFEFDWGSIDGYNTLVIHSSAGDKQVVPGTMSFPNAANGNQITAGTNGLFRVTADAGETFSGVTLSSSGNSFEVDNLAIGAVPEPATWAMMLIGLGSLGTMLRLRRRETSVAACA